MDRILRVGETVWAQGKRVGKVVKLLTMSGDREPTHIVVKVGRLQRREIVVPAAKLEGIDEEGVKLAIDEKTLLDLPDYEVDVKSGEYRKPTAMGNPRPYAVYTPPANNEYTHYKHTNVPGSVSTLRRGMSVIDVNGKAAGEVQGVIAEQGRVEKFILGDPRPTLKRDRIISADLVAEVRASTVRLNVELDDLDGLTTAPEEPGE